MSKNPSAGVNDIKTFQSFKKQTSKPDTIIGVYQYALV